MSHPTGLVIQVGDLLNRQLLNFFPTWITTSTSNQLRILILINLDWLTLQIGHHLLQIKQLQRHPPTRHSSQLESHSNRKPHSHSTSWHNYQLGIRLLNHLHTSDLVLSRPTGNSLIQIRISQIITQHPTWLNTHQLILQFHTHTSTD